MGSRGFGSQNCRRPGGHRRARLQVGFPRREGMRHANNDCPVVVRFLGLVCGGVLWPAACRGPAHGRRAGDPDRRDRPPVPRPVLHESRRVAPGGDAAEGGGRGDLPQYDQGRIYPRRQLREGRAARPQCRPHMEPAGDGDDGGRQRRIPGGRAVGRHPARVRHSAQPQRRLAGAEGHARCRCVGGGRPRGRAGQCGNRRQTRR